MVTVRVSSMKISWIKLVRVGMKNRELPMLLLEINYDSIIE